MSIARAVNTKKIAVSIPLPGLNLDVKKIKAKIFQLFSKFYNPARRQEFSNRAMPFLRNVKLPNINLRKEKIIKIAIPLIVVVAAVVIVRVAMSGSNSNQNTLGAVTDISVPRAIATAELNRDFSFPLKNGEGDEVGRFDYAVESAELKKQIIVKGQRATAVEGRMFLIINLKITNSIDQLIELNTRDFIRIIVNGNEEELLAADIHNDPVEVQAISTKRTRLAIAIDETDADIILRVGEINGDKETIELEF